MRPKFRMSFQISLLCVAGALSSGVVMLAASVIQAPPDVPFCFMLGFGLTTLFWTLGRLIARMHWAAVLTVTAFTAFVAWFFEITSTLMDFFYKYIRWVYFYNLAKPDPTQFGTVSTMVLTGIVSAILAARFVAARPNLLVTLTFYLIVIFLPYPYVDMQYFILAANIIIIALLMFAVLSEYIQKAMRFGTKLSALPYQTIGIPVCALIILLSTLLPWSNQKHELPEFVTDITSGFSLFSRDFKLNETGRVNLGGGNRMSDKLMLTLYSERPMYLYAECYDNYTGDSWEVSDKEIYAYDYHLYSQLAGYGYLSYVQSEQMPFRVVYNNLSTDILLMPHNIESLSIINPPVHEIFMTSGMVFRVKPKAEKGMNYESAAHISGMAEAAAIDTVLFNLLGGDYFDLYDNHDMTLYNGRTKILQGETDLSPYLQIPGSVTLRTRELADELTDGFRTFTQKALAIQNYLAKEYPYTLDAPRLPKNTDFVDFFLFDAKTGYCTSYASAMTIMLRCVGIPARYCEGFAPDVRNYDGEAYAVYGTDAHAWVEAYVPFVGWVAFDPTGSSNAAAYRDGAMSGETPAPTPTASPSPTPDASPTPTPTSTPTPDAEPSPTPTPSHGQTDKREIPKAVRIILVVLAVTVPALIWLFGGRFFVGLRLKRVSRRHPNAQARFWYGRIQKLLRAEGIAAYDYETMREFVARVQEKLPSSGIDLLPAIALLEKTSYNGEDITAKDLDTFRSAHRQLADGLHAGWHPARQWWEKHVTWRLLW